MSHPYASPIFELCWESCLAVHDDLLDHLQTRHHAWVQRHCCWVADLSLGRAVDHAAPPKLHSLGSHRARALPRSDPEDQAPEAKPLEALLGMKKHHCGPLACLSGKLCPLQDQHFHVLLHCASNIQILHAGSLKALLGMKGCLTGRLQAGTRYPARHAGCGERTT